MSSTYPYSSREYKNKPPEKGRYSINMKSRLTTRSISAIILIYQWMF